MSVAVEIRYHVPRSQVWEGSGGHQQGHNHLHVLEHFERGRLVRGAGRALCGKNGWYETTDPHDAKPCPRCVAMAKRHGVEWPQEVTAA